MTIRRCAVFASALATTGCGGDAGTESGGYALSVETFNVGLAGAFIGYEEERRDALGEAISGLDADVVCLEEVWRQSDKDLLADAVSAEFPYSASFTHDLDTAIDDATDQNGDVPPAPTTAPCASDVLRPLLDTALGCLRESCSTVPGSDDGQTTSTDCAEAECFPSVADLLLSEDPDALRCYACIATSLPTETFGDIRDLCTTEPNAGLAFRGQSGVMILSKHPLSDEGAIVLPGTWNRRAIAYATATLPNDAAVDLYCNHLTPIFDSTAYPYTGQYGQGEISAAGWEAEQTLQAEKLVARVGEQSGDGAAIVLGDFNASRGYSEDGSVVVAAEGVGTLDVLDAAFVPAIASDYEPICTFCPDNPLNTPDTPPTWIDLVYLANVPATAVRSTERNLFEASVTTPDGAVPLSDHYGLRAVVSIGP
jgi:endonuclease/exonuclease/phosphatase family metal-dependent hydrolase